MYSLFLHIIHITCGVFWGGTALFLHFFVIPAVKNGGADGSKILQSIMATRKLPLVLFVNSLVTIGAGILLMEYVSGGFQKAWFQSTMGIVLSIGATTGSLALLVAMFVNKPAADRLAFTGAQIEQSGQKPTDEQIEVLTTNKNRLMAGLKYIAWLMIITLICMSGAHYF